MAKSLLKYTNTKCINLSWERISSPPQNFWKLDVWFDALTHLILEYPTCKFLLLPPKKCQEPFCNMVVKESRLQGEACWDSDFWKLALIFVRIQMTLEMIMDIVAPALTSTQPWNGKFGLDLKLWRDPSLLRLFTLLPFCWCCKEILKWNRMSSREIH